LTATATATATATEWRNREGHSAEPVGDLSFQKLDVYRCTIEFLALSRGLRRHLPKGQCRVSRATALRGSIDSAEHRGNGRRTSEADGARHDAIARGSAMECAAIVDALDVLSDLEDAKREQAGDLLGRIVAMLTRLCR